MVFLVVVLIQLNNMNINIIHSLIVVCLVLFLESLHIFSIMTNPSLIELLEYNSYHFIYCLSLLLLFC